MCHSRITFCVASQERNDPANRGSRAQIGSYLLRSGRRDTALRGAFSPFYESTVQTFDGGAKPSPNIQSDPGKIGVVGSGTFYEIMRDGIKERGHRLPITTISRRG